MKLKYPADLIARIKTEIPNEQSIHELLDTGSERVDSAINMLLGDDTLRINDADILSYIDRDDINELKAKVVHRIRLDQLREECAKVIWEAVKAGYRLVGR